MTRGRGFSDPRATGPRNSSFKYCCSTIRRCRGRHSTWRAGMTGDVHPSWEAASRGLPNLCPLSVHPHRVPYRDLPRKVHQGPAGPATRELRVGRTSGQGGPGPNKPQDLLRVESCLPKPKRESGARERPWNGRSPLLPTPYPRGSARVRPVRFVVPPGTSRLGVWTSKG